MQIGRPKSYWGTCNNPIRKEKKAEFTHYYTNVKIFV